MMPNSGFEDALSSLHYWDEASAASSDPFDRCLFAWCLALPQLRAKNPAKYAARAVDLLERSAASTSNPAPRIWLTSARGVAARLARDFDTALRHYEQAIEQARAVGHHNMMATTALFITSALAQRGGPIDRDAYARAIDLTCRYHRFEAPTVALLTSHLLRNGHVEPGSTLHGFVTTAQASSPGVPWPDLPDVAEARAWSATGAAMTLDEASEYAVEALAGLPAD